MEYIGKATLYILSIIIGVVLGGLLVMNFWEWFISPVFDLKTLTLGQSVGISTFLTLFKSTNFSQKSDIGASTAIMSSIVYQLLILVFGWIVSLFI